MENPIRYSLPFRRLQARRGMLVFGGVAATSILVFLGFFASIMVLDTSFRRPHWTWGELLRKALWDNLEPKPTVLLISICICFVAGAVYVGGRWAPGKTDRSYLSVLAGAWQMQKGTLAAVLGGWISMVAMMGKAEPWGMIVFGLMVLVLLGPVAAVLGAASAWANARLQQDLIDRHPDFDAA